MIQLININKMYIINDSDKTIQYKENIYSLPRKQFQLFKCLRNNSNKLISREEILKNIWEQDIIVSKRTIDVHILRLRKTFPDAPIVTRKCFGYMWKEKL